MTRFALFAALLSSVAFAQAPVECTGNTCNVGQRGNDIVLGGQVQCTVGPLGDGGTVYVQPYDQAATLAIVGRRPSGAATVPDVIIGSKNTHTGAGSIISFRNGLNEVFAINSSGASGTAVAASSWVGFLDAGSIADNGSLTFTNTAAVSEIISWCPASVAGTTVAAVQVKTATALDSTDLLFSVMSSAGANLFGVGQSGRVTLYLNDLQMPAGADVTGGRTFISTATSGQNSLNTTVEGARVVIGPDTYCDETGTALRCVAASMRVSGSFETTAGTITSADNLITLSGADLLLGRSVYMSSGGTYRLTDADPAPTLTGGCTSPAVTWANGSALFQIDVGTTCAGVSTIVLTFPTASNGWECKCTNTTAAATRVIDSSAWSTTAVTITNYSRTLGTAADFADGADIRCMCRGG